MDGFYTEMIMSQTILVHHEDVGDPLKVCGKCLILKNRTQKDKSLSKLCFTEILEL